MCVLLVEGATRPGYNAWVRFGSELSLSDQGYLQIINFIVGGVLIVVGAVGVIRALGSSWGTRLLIAFGLSLVTAGIFVMDPRPGYPVDVVRRVPQTVHGILHGLSGLVCFSSLAAAASILARRFRGSAWAAYWRELRAEVVGDEQRGVAELLRTTRSLDPPAGKTGLSNPRVEIDRCHVLRGDAEAEPVRSRPGLLLEEKASG